MTVAQLRSSAPGFDWGAWLAAGGVRYKEDWVELANLAAFPASLRELMGIVGSNKVDHPWYTGPVYAQPLLGSAEDDDGPLSVNSTSTFKNFVCFIFSV